MMPNRSTSPNVASLADTRGYARPMPHITVPLSDAQAQVLSERARAAQRPSDEVLRDIVTTALDEGVENVEELDEAAIDRAFADFATAYPDLCDTLFASDPDLGTQHDGGDSDWPSESGQEVTELPVALGDSSATTSEGAGRTGSKLTSGDVDRAFGNLADQYEEIAQDLFGSEEPRGAGRLDSRDLQSTAPEFPGTSRLFVLTKYLPVGSPSAEASSAADDLTSHVYMQLPSDKSTPRGIVVLISRDHLEEIARLPKA